MSKTEDLLIMEQRHAILIKIMWRWVWNIILASFIASVGLVVVTTILATVQLQYLWLWGAGNFPVVLMGLLILVLLVRLFFVARPASPR